MKMSLQFLIVGSLLFASCQTEISPELLDENVAGSGIHVVTSRITGGDLMYASTKLVYDNGEIDEGGGDECKTDDLYRYESDGDATFVNGAVPCFPDGPTDGKYANWE